MMGPVDTSGLAQYLGPLTGGGFMGEQQRNAMQESEIQQRRGLEEILTQQQNRDITRQKLPGELEMQTQNVLFKKGEIAKQGTDAEAAQKKLKKEDYQEFLDGLTQMNPQAVGVADRAEYLNDLSKRTGIPVDHPMYKIALQAHAGGPKVWDEFSKAFKVSPETRYKEEQSNARTAAQGETSREVAQIGADSRTEVARIRAERAQAKAAQVKQTTDQLIAKYTEEMMTEQDPNRKTQLAAYIKFLQEGKIAIAQAAGSGRTDELERTMAMFQDAAMKAPPPRPLPSAPVAPGAAAPTAAPQAAAAPQARNIPPVNAKGWKLMVDKNGNKAYVGPNQEIEPVQ